MEEYPMKISFFIGVQCLGWLICLVMAWTALHIYFTKDDPLGGIFCLLLAIFFSLFLIHLVLFQLYEQQRYLSRQEEAILSQSRQVEVISKRGKQ